MNTFNISQEQIVIIARDMDTHMTSDKSEGIITRMFASVDPEGTGSLKIVAFLEGKTKARRVQGDSPIGVVCRMLTSVARKRFKSSGEASTRMLEAQRFVDALRADEESSFDAAWAAVMTGVESGGVKDSKVQNSGEWLSRFGA